MRVNKLALVTLAICQLGAGAKFLLVRLEDDGAEGALPPPNQAQTPLAKYGDLSKMQRSGLLFHGIKNSGYYARKNQDKVRKMLEVEAGMDFSNFPGWRNCIRCVSRLLNPFVQAANLNLAGKAVKFELAFERLKRRTPGKHCRRQCKGRFDGKKVKKALMDKMVQLEPKQPLDFGVGEEQGRKRPRGRREPMVSAGKPGGKKPRGTREPRGPREPQVSGGKLRGKGSREPQDFGGKGPPEPQNLGSGREQGGEEEEEEEEE